MVASYTSHADWEKGWDYAWPIPNDKCPVNENPSGDERWYDCAPYPHGNTDNCIGSADCIHPRKYTYTESGLLDRIEGEEAGRGDDYGLVTSASFYPMNYTDPPLSYNFILGYSWHSFYDSGFLSSGDESADCENWGIVNPKCLKSGESSGEHDQYLELHESIRDMNGSIQEELGDGSTWSTIPGPDPPPETTNPFVCGD